MTPATINFPESIVRGDTLNSFYVDFTAGGNPLGIVTATVTLKSAVGLAVYSWDVTTTSSRVTCGAVPAAMTSTWAAGTYSYAMRLTLDTGAVVTPIVGSLVVT